MKKIHSLLMILPLLIACDSETEIPVGLGQQDTVASLNKILDGPSPANISNVYDDAGILHNQLIDEYGLTGILPSSVDSIIGRVEALALNNSQITLKKTSAYAPLTVSRANYLLTSGTGCLDEVMANTGLSPAVKGNFSDFITSLITVCGTEPSYTTVLNFITAYEAIVMTNLLITPQEKKLILTITSIVRHSAFYRRKPKRNTDIDWEFMITHIVATVEGASAGTAEAITTSVAISIAENL